ncbi:MAG: hypothetical protein ACODAQ_03380 [Phycisphaeraceae bacterium]
MADENDQTRPLHPEQLTWAVLLGQWVEFAKRAVGLPQDDAGRRMRDSVPDVIMLQAVWFALQHLEELDAEERALGLDRAEVLIEKHTATLRKRWQNVEMPSELHKLIDDAHAQLAEAQRQHGR